MLPCTSRVLPNNSLKPSPLRGLDAARYDWTIAKAAKRPGLAQALCVVMLVHVSLGRTQQQIDLRFPIERALRLTELAFVATHQRGLREMTLASLPASA
ncbi:MAG: hypothetical protein EOO81_06100 [Oxalobacteraceae bacterium]|nr:MAG: hypothetical protein EOO81_06100 [Oxalobacteraceae bacterium]